MSCSIDVQNLIYALRSFIIILRVDSFVDILYVRRFGNDEVIIVFYMMGVICQLSILVRY